MFEKYEKKKSLIEKVKTAGIGILIGTVLCLILGWFLVFKFNAPDWLQIILFVIVYAVVIFLTFMVKIGNKQQQEKNNKNHNEDVFK